jgi:hypothetical protein
VNSSMLGGIPSTSSDVVVVLCSSSPPEPPEPPESPEPPDGGMGSGVRSTGGLGWSDGRTTSTRNVRVASLPAPSLATHDTRVTPIGNVEPLGGEHATATRPSRSSGRSDPAPARGAGPRRRTRRAASLDRRRHGEHRHGCQRGLADLGSHRGGVAVLRRGIGVLAPAAPAARRRRGCLSGSRLAAPSARPIGGSRRARGGRRRAQR